MDDTNWDTFRRSAKEYMLRHSWELIVLYHLVCAIRAVFRVVYAAILWCMSGISERKKARRLRKAILDRLRESSYNDVEPVTLDRFDEMSLDDLRGVYIVGESCYARATEPWLGMKRGHALCERSLRGLARLGLRRWLNPFTVRPLPLFLYWKMTSQLGPGSSARFMGFTDHEALRKHVKRVCTGLVDTDLKAFASVFDCPTEGGSSREVIVARILSRLKSTNAHNEAHDSGIRL